MDKNGHGTRIAGILGGHRQVMGHKVDEGSVKLVSQLQVVSWLMLGGSSQDL